MNKKGLHSSTIRKIYNESQLKAFIDNNNVNHKINQGKIVRNNIEELILYFAYEIARKQKEKILDTEKTV